MPRFSPEADPLYSLKRSLFKASWKQDLKGLESLVATSQDFDITVHAWRIDLKRFTVSAQIADTSTGRSAQWSREQNPLAVLAFTGGFFDRENERKEQGTERKRFDGLVLIDGTIHSERWSGLEEKNGGFFIIRDGRASIEPSNASPEVYRSASLAVQSLPILIDPGGVFAMRSENHAAARRTALCVQNDQTLVLIFVENSGLTLYQLAKLLHHPAQALPFQCDSAIGLDGGPSAQVSYKPSSSAVLELEGNWTTPYSLIVLPRRNATP